jgi:small-conductance mechanosensitive channel
MIEIEHEGSGPYAEKSTVRWNNPLLTIAEATERLEAVADESLEEQLQEKEDRIDELEGEIEDLKAERNARVRKVVEIARKMLAGNATIRDDVALDRCLRAQLAGMTPDELRREEDEVTRFGFRRISTKRRNLRRRP